CRPRPALPSFPPSPRSPLPVAPRRLGLPPLEGVNEARGLGVAQPLGYLANRHPMREHFLGERFADFVQQPPERGSLGGEMPVEGARGHTHLGGDAFHLRAPPRPEEVLANLLRDARAGSPPVEELAALLLAQARRPLVSLGQRLIRPSGIDRDTVHGFAEEDRPREVLGESIRVGGA